MYKPVAKKLSDITNPISRRQRFCVEKQVVQIKVKVCAMASDRRRPKASLLKPTAEVTKKSSIVLTELLTTNFVIRFILKHQNSLIGTGHADAGRIAPGIPPMLPAERQQLSWALQQPVSMARWHRGEA